jgi:hypothetical protein
MIYWGERFAKDDGSIMTGTLTMANWWHTSEVDVNGDTEWTGWAHTNGNSRIQDGQPSLWGW